MKLPEQEWFTIGELAQRWAVSENYIEQMIETRKLLAEVKQGNGLPGVDPSEAREHERCKRLIYDPTSSVLPGGIGWPFGSKVIVTIREVKRFENESCASSAPTGRESGFDMAEHIRTSREKKIPEEQIIYELRKRGFSNNEVGIALGGTYRKGSNALAMRISKKYNSHKKKLGG